MEHLLLKAATTVATDEGVFTAVISSATVDREKDVVSPAGMVRALHKWAKLGKKIPLAWNHSSAAADQIGYIDPASVRAQGDEVIATGWVDQSADVGREAWRSFKAGTVGFSFGYLIPDGGATKRKGGGRNINELDVFEITATPAPMNADTRVLGWKALKGASTVGPAARGHLENLIKYYMAKPHPFGSCVQDNTKRFGPDGADRVCATLKDIGTGTTHWRHGGNHGKAATSDGDMQEMCQALYDAAGGDLEALLEMWHAHMTANGDNPEDMMMPAPGKAAGRALRRRADALALEHATAGVKQTATDTEDEDDPAELIGQLISMAQDFIDDEDDPADVSVMRQVMALLLQLQGAEAQEDGKALKATWSTAYVNNLPDSAFLYVAPGGSKDSDGKTTPRSLRYFPVRDANGTVDQEHVRNALSRIPQSNLPQTVKDSCAAKAKRLLDSSKSVADRTGTSPVDPLRRLADAVALEFASDGESLRKPPAQKAAPKPTPEIPLDELRRRSREEMLIALSGVEEP